MATAEKKVIFFYDITFANYLIYYPDLLDYLNDRFDLYLLAEEDVGSEKLLGERGFRTIHLNQRRHGGKYFAVYRPDLLVVHALRIPDILLIYEAKKADIFTFYF